MENENVTVEILKVKGRGRFVALAWQLDDGTTQIRLDDSHDPEFWAEITLRIASVTPPEG